MEKQKKYGYVRVSTKEQNEDRQIKAMLDYGIPKERIFIDKQSGKDFNRIEYQTLKRMLKDSPNSLLVIHSIDRLGRNYKEITKEWKELTTECKADIKVIDMPLLDTTQYKDLLGSFISDLILQVLSFVAEQERSNIRKRQAEGIAVAKAQGKELGRPRAEITPEFIVEWKKWKKGEQTANQTMINTNTKRTTFYKFNKILEKN
ncbi:MAG: recombinase family protein [Clostridiales bacterium]|nr:recombinase family protein [Clostridiales bacterium]